jgi:hypothetical protein
MRMKSPLRSWDKHKKRAAKDTSLFAKSPLAARYNQNSCLLAFEAGTNENLNLGGCVAGDFHANADFNDHRCGPSHCVSSV